MKVIIVGGGVAGCTAALFLKKIGMEVSLYEKYPSPPALQIGAALGLGSNGFSTLALYSEKLAQAIYNRGHRSPFWEMREHDGTLLGFLPAGRENRYGKFGTSLLRRWDVHDVLLKEVEARGINIQYGKKVVGVEENTISVRVTFEDGSFEVADLVVGADGARSKVREFVAPKAKIVYTGYVGVGGNIPKNKLSFDANYFNSIKRGKKEIGAIMTYGPLGFFGFGPCDDKTPEEGGVYTWWSNFASEELQNTIVDPVFAPNPENVVKELKERHGSW
jgi:2-polyprenyl-6-methoxyphenol hydroxylase-like FAD-dependent oxidoreductase